MSEKAQVQETKKSDMLSKMRSNPWMMSTFVLGALLLLLLVLNGTGITGNTVGRDTVSDDVMAYLKTQVQGEITLKSVEKESGLYKLTVEYQGDEIPVYATADGKNLVSGLVPLDGTVAGAGEPVPTGEPINVEIGDAPFKGNVNAPVVIVEFSDYQCPFCERAYSDAVTQIDTNYVKTGKVKFVYMDFPLGFHPEAQPAAEAARCFEFVKGGNDAEYFKFHDKLFENQASLSNANYKKWAKELGANSAQFDSCLDSGKFADAVQADADYGATIGVSGTPAFFVNGKLVSGAQPYAKFKQMIDAELAA